jgi:hypothetical protein
MLIQDPKYWRGAIALDKEIVASRNLSVIGADPNQASPKKLNDWFEWIVPTCIQNGNTCGGECWANWLEPMIRRYVGLKAIPAGMQLNGYAVWFEAKQLFYNKCLAGGITLAEGFVAMKSLGWIPEDTELVTVKEDIDSINVALEMTPVVHAGVVTEGWFWANPKNGCIEDDFRYARGGTMGHAFVIVGVLRKNGKRFVTIDPSWGERYGWYGLATMSELMLNAITLLGGPCTATIEGGWETRLKTHAGWEKGLISTPSDEGGIRI